MPVQRSRWSGRFPRPDSPARFAGIFGKAHPAVFIAYGPGRLVCGEVASDPLFLIQPNDPGILPHHALVENPARENIEVLLFQGLPGDGC